MVASYPPLILGQPEDHVGSVGGSASLSVTATGCSTLSHQWRFNGNPIPGATASTYPKSNLALTNAGYYCVLVSGP